MKYRIKQEIFEDRSEYSPQRKFLFFWIDLKSKPFDNKESAEKFIAYYDLVKNKKNLVYHIDLIPDYGLLEKEPQMTIDDIIEYLEKKIETRENDSSDPLPCGHLKTTLSVLKEIKEDTK